MKHVRIDRAKRLKDDPGTGHNRWHPDIPPILSVEPGEEVVLETRDARDGQILLGATVEDLDRHDQKVAHPLTGPIYIDGAEPGDLLEIEYLDIEPEAHGWTRFYPGAGLLRDLFPKSFLVHWDLGKDWARSPDIPGVRIPCGAFMGTAGLAPSREQFEQWSRREADLRARGGIAWPPDLEDAVPSADSIAREGLRTAPPRENCGNVDIKQLTRGSRLYIPVSVPGALYSVGDAHFAQGDGECCVTAIEMGATATVRFRVHSGEARRKNIRWPRFAHPGMFAPPEWAAPSNFIATMGMPLREDGTQECEDLTLAARNALIEMIQLLEERGYSRDQAYIICSVAVDLRISNVVDLPNVTVSAFLPEAIFER
jgi:formamidase